MDSGGDRQTPAGQAPERARGVALASDARRDLLVAAVLLVLAASGLARTAGFGGNYVIHAGLLQTMGCTLAWHHLATNHPHARFGAANRATLARLTLASLLAAVIGEQMTQPDWLAWAVVVVATMAALTDAADGTLARHSGLASDFGARFDMETDAWLTLVLCGLVVHFDKAGAWVLAGGLLRYAFAASAMAWPWLAGELRPSLRRKAVCVAQITTLIVCLGPVVPRWAATALAAAALCALAASFAIDVRALAASSKEHRA